MNVSQGLKRLRKETGFELKFPKTVPQRLKPC